MLKTNKKWANNNCVGPDVQTSNELISFVPAEIDLNKYICIKYLRQTPTTLQELWSIAITVYKARTFSAIYTVYNQAKVLPPRSLTCRSSTETRAARHDNQPDFPHIWLHPGINVHHYSAELEKNESSEVEDYTLKSIFGIYGMPVTRAAMCQLKSCWCKTDYQNHPPRLFQLQFSAAQCSQYHLIW